MFYQCRAKFLSPALSALLLILLFAPQAISGPAGDEGIRADLPPGNVLRVENRRGGISVEVWGENYVSVTAAVEGPAPKRSPVIIGRTEQSLAVSVGRGETGSSPPTRVDLTLRVPERARTEIITTTGAIVIRGAPAELSAQTVSGNIHALLSPASGANITAEALTGNTAFENCAPRLGREDIYSKCRLGAGDKPVRLRSERGRIVVASPEGPRDQAIPSEARRSVPTLIGADKNKAGAGTPSTPLAGPEEVDEGDVVRVDTELVTLNVSVIDRGTNRGLKGLAEGDFKLFEDGSEQQITHFESSSAPFNLILLMDLSFSTKEKIGLIRDAALHFVNAARPADRIGIITFAKTPIVVSRLTDDREALRRSIGQIVEPRASTKVYDSLAYALDEVLKDSKDSRRNAIVLMSDGLDSTLPNVSGEGSTISYNELLSRVREFDGVLYTLWLDTTYEPLSVLDIQEETFDLAYDRMEELSEAGGGLFYEVEKLEDLADAYDRVVADLGTVYSLSYRPTNRLRDGKWRAIRVAVGRPDAVARGKRGYYAN
ncbi:MAG TPA: VWA domain-containing protein [Pyrinomonadaceae bacterium]